jgi:hypothetical protein
MLADERILLSSQKTKKIKKKTPKNQKKTFFYEIKRT